MADQIIEVPGQGKIVFPDSMSDADIVAAIRKISTPAPTTMQKIQASGPLRWIQGMRDPIDAGAQMISRMVPESVTNALDYIPAKLRESQNPLISSLANAYLADPRPQAIDKNIADTERNYQAARKATGQEGLDATRLGGNIISPANAALAKLIPMGGLSTVPKMAATGAGLGAAGGALTPVSDEAAQKDFATAKAVQTGAGALTGAIATPVIGKVLQAAAPHVERILNKITGVSEIQGVRASLETNTVIRQALADLGQTADDIPKAQMEALRQQVLSALKNGKKLDAAALMRKSDFDAIGLPATQGQITRDPTQFARERNLRGVAGVGDPLQARFTTQNAKLQEQLGGYAQGATDKVTAGERIAEALASADKSIKGRVDSAYGMARDSLGRAAPMDSAEFSRMANLALDDQMLGHFLPTEVRSILNGITKGEIPLTVDSAVKIDQTLSAAQRAAGNGTPQALAIGKVRDALNKSPIADNVGEDAKKLFDAARGMARERFQLHDAIPALKAAANGDVAPDAFVRKFIVNGNAAEVQRLAKMLGPQAFQEARAQIGATIQRAAFGENLAGDKLLAPERLAKALRDIGPQKLGAFFNPQEVEQINRIARVGSYINSAPAAAAVNNSNTAATALNLAGRVPGIGNAARIASALVQPVMNQRAASAAMNPVVPATAQASPEAIRKAQLAAALAGLGLGGSSSSSLRQ